MSATIEVNGLRATVEDGAWHCDDPVMLDRIESLSLSQYLPDGAQAREVIATLGGVLLSEDDPAEDLDDDGEQVIH